MFWGGASPCRGLHEKGGKRHDVPAHHGAEEAVEEYGRRGRPRGREGDAVSEGRPGGLSGRPRGRRAVLAMIKRRAAAAGAAGDDVLPHVSGDGHHGVPVERGDARARAADRRPRVAEDDEAVRPDGGHDHARRDRTHRDLRGGPGGRVRCRARRGLPSVEHDAAELARAAGGASGDRAGRRFWRPLPAGREAPPAALGSRGAGKRGLPNRSSGRDRSRVPRRRRTRRTAPLWGLELVRGVSWHTAAAGAAPRKNRSGRPDAGGR